MRLQAELPAKQSQPLVIPLLHMMKTLISCLLEHQDIHVLAKVVSVT